jgi:hypothetical protein
MYLQTCSISLGTCMYIYAYIHTYIYIYNVCVSLSIFFLVAPTLEHRTSVKRSVSVQFLNPKAVGRSPWMGDQSRRKAVTYKNTEYTQTNIHALSGIRIHDPSFRAGEQFMP